MQDALTCPICGLKLRTFKQKNKFLYFVNKQANYIERACSKGLNHTLTFFTDAQSGQVDLIKLSLNPKYSKFLEIDFVNQKCRITCYKGVKVDFIEIKKMINPDFPNLLDLKSKINLYLTFS